MNVPPLLGQTGDKAANLICIADVKLGGKNLDALANLVADLVGDVAESVHAAGGEHEAQVLGACAGKLQGSGAANAGRCACDEDGLAGEALGRCRSHDCPGWLEAGAGCVGGGGFGEAAGDEGRRGESPGGCCRGGGGGGEAAAEDELLLAGGRQGEGAAGGETGDDDTHEAADAMTARSGKSSGAPERFIGVSRGDWSRHLDDEAVDAMRSE